MLLYKKLLLMTFGTSLVHVTAYRYSYYWHIHTYLLET